VNWKRNIQVLDLEPNVRLELVCRKCGKLRWLTGQELLERQSARYLYLEDVERRARCREWQCLVKVKHLALWAALHNSSTLCAIVTNRLKQKLQDER
jgi:hypothetical protein